MLIMCISMMSYENGRVLQMSTVALCLGVAAEAQQNNATEPVMYTQVCITEIRSHGLDFISTCSCYLWLKCCNVKPLADPLWPFWLFGREQKLLIRNCILR